MLSARTFTVTELNASIRGLLETQFPFVSVVGEISNLRQPLSGHLYFTLKDEGAQLKAVLFKMQQRYLAEQPTDGRLVVCRGRLSVYEPRGEYQLIVDAIDFQGAGNLRLAFERLKKRLAAEGLFEQARKKPLPPLPEHITLVTSPRGAAVHDFLRIARLRFPGLPVTVCPVAVQGNQAAAEIAEAIAIINAHFPASVIVLCRGGGSLEDLQAFNEESVARAIGASRLPVVSAVGHETDFTIADLVADLRAPTPSAAAQMLLPDAAELLLRIDIMRKRLQRQLKARLERSSDRLFSATRRLDLVVRWLDHLQLLLAHRTSDLERTIRVNLTATLHLLDRHESRLRAASPLARLQMRQLRLADLHRRLLATGKATLDGVHQAMARATALLEAVSPLATLARGYAIVQTPAPEAKVVTDSRQVRSGGRVDILLHRGTLTCTIEKTGENRFAEIAGKEEKEEGSVEE